MASISGGAKFEAALRELSQKVTNAATVEIGFPADATESDGTPVALVAAINEYGAPSRGQPPRPFFRQMIAAKSAEWPDAIAGLLKANNFDARATLGKVGEAIKGQLEDSISNFSGVPLKPATIKRKGFAKQLIHTGKMLTSVKSVVK